ncbi:MAG: SUMF1/EgtB/PvdO family nonheme iron enzyme [Chloroflexi bacterium]|uniref:SUMF1/EgtB/PvdO family nonheme iron enzyme n=1 Tax=Candidatus Flexifilum breve TaxID=3140694 RepID=UPI0031354F37|nr:SUMF1/EgtB/PvdO family nonheme iron enzyme [Chloroflexota bacterium]
MPHIFISYAKKDTRALAEALVAALNAIPDISAWMDVSLEADSSWAGQIQHEIDRCDYVVVLLSPDLNRAVTATQRRSFVLNEIDYVQQENKPILPVMVQQTKIPVQLAGIQYIDLTQRPNDPDPIVKRVQRRFNLASTPEPVVVPKEERQQLSRTPLIIGAGGVLVLIAFVALILPPLINPSTAPTATTGQVVQTGGDTPTLTYRPNLVQIVAQTQTHEIEQTLTAMPTATFTPTVDFQATIDAIATGTRAALQTANAATLTAMPTQTPRPTDTAVQPTVTPTDTSTVPPSPTALSDLLQAALDTARTFTGSNTDWQALYPEGFQHRFDDDVPMVLVPAGSFTIGANPQSDNEQNGNLIHFDAPFWIDRTEVAQVDFEQLGGVKSRTNDYDGDQRPVENISWFEAHNFCVERGARLATEAEWEYAARGPSEWDYPWGDSWNGSYAVWNRSVEQGTTNVGSIPAGRSWVGALDMSGNVWEWVSSMYEDYPYNQSHENNNTANTLHVLRGVSWNFSDPYFLRAGYRNRDYSNSGLRAVGFRCARSS